MNKQSITFSASEQTLEKTGGIDNYASNIVSYVEATFTLGENWTGYDVVRAVWESAYAKISTVLDSDHKCVVPAEVLRHKSKVNVNLVGSIVTNDVLTDRLTTYPVHAITVDADARVDSTETQPITPSQFEQFVEAVHADAESIQDYSYDSEAWAKGTRGGVAVPSTDPTYHNNSKYYADQGAELEQEVSDLKSDYGKAIRIIVGKNLIDGNALVTGFVQSDGTVSTSGAWASYLTSDFIELEGNTDYAFTCISRASGAVATSRNGYILYDASKTAIGTTYVNNADGGTLTFNSASAKYVKVSIIGGGLVDAQLEKGTAFTKYEAYYKRYISIADFNINNEVYTSDEAFESRVSKADHLNRNLVDPSAIEKNKFITGDGIVSLNGYNTCDFIPISAGQKITFSPQVRSVALWTLSKNFVMASYQNVTSSSPYTYTASVDGYIRASFYASNEGTYQAEYGDVATAFIPYDGNKYFEEDVLLSDTMKTEVRQIVASDDSTKMSITKSGNSLAVISSNNGHSLKRMYTLDADNSHNLNFNFKSALVDGVTIKASDDDITPQRVGLENGGEWTIGANHGWPCYRVSKGNLATADVGSIWTDGTRQYVLALVDSSYAYFLRPCSKVDELYSIDMTNPAADLTHVSGATHTSTVSISGGASSQLYPSVNNHSIDLIINDKTITADGTYLAYAFDIKEHYEIMDYVAMSDYLKAHIGSDLASIRNNIDSVLALDYIYHVTNLDEIVFTCATAIAEVNLANSGFMQSSIIEANGGTVYRYVNGVKDGTTFASSGLVNMTSYSTTHSITKNDLLDSNKPSNRCVDICKDGSDNIKYGFAFGFIPDKSYGSDNKRSENLSVTVWDMRDTKKSYPYCVRNKSLVSGESLQVVGYRHYIMPNAPLTNKAVIKIANETYMFVDAHARAFGSFDIGKLGQSVEILDEQNINVSDIVGAKGVTFNSSSNYSSGVFKA